MNWDDGIETKNESGDGDAYVTATATTFSAPTVSLSCNTPLTLTGSIYHGVEGTLVCTSYDSRNYAVTGGGAFTLTLSNARISTSSGGGAHREFQQRALAFVARSSDGQTSPMAFAAV